MSTSDKYGNPFHGPDWMDLVSHMEEVRVALRKLLPVHEPPFDLGAIVDDVKAFFGVRGEWTNWARNQHATPAARHRPDSEKEVRDAIVDARRNDRKVRVLGSGYSFSPLVPTDGDIIDLTGMHDSSVNVASKTITVEAGITIARLQHALRQKNLCLESAPVIPWVTVGGALGTGVHGTGSAHGTLADLVVEAQVMDANGEVHVVKGAQSGSLGDEGRALGCNLGALGVVTEVTLQAVDLFNLEAKDDTRNHWFQDTMLSRDGLRSLLQQAPYVSSLWWPTTERVWVKTWKRTAAPRSTHEVQYFLDQLGIRLGAGVVTKTGKLLADHPAWTPIFAATVFDQIKHQEHVSPSPEVFHFLTQYPMVWNMSYAFDVEGYSDRGIDRVVEAYKALVDILEHYRDDGLFPQNMATHMRHIRSSSSFLSPSTGHDGSVALEIVALQGQDYGLWSKFFATVECEWLQLSGRPHWGKLHSWGKAGGEPHNQSQLQTIRDLYPAANRAAFSEVRRAWDPQHVFENPYTVALQL